MAARPAHPSAVATADRSLHPASLARLPDASTPSRQPLRDHRDEPASPGVMRGVRSIELDGLPSPTRTRASSWSMTPADTPSPSPWAALRPPPVRDRDRPQSRPLNSRRARPSAPACRDPHALSRSVRPATVVALVAIVQSILAADAAGADRALEGRDLATARAIEFLGRSRWVCRIDWSAPDPRRLANGAADPRRLRADAARRPRASVGAARLRVGRRGSGAGLKRADRALGRRVRGRSSPHRVRRTRASSTSESSWDHHIRCTPWNCSHNCNPSKPPCARGRCSLAEARALRNRAQRRTRGRSSSRGQCLAGAGAVPGGRTAEAVEAAQRCWRCGSGQSARAAHRPRRARRAHRRRRCGCGAEELSLWPDGSRWVGHQGHRDVEFWLALPPGS